MVQRLVQSCLYASYNYVCMDIPLLNPNPIPIHPSALTPNPFSLNFGYRAYVWFVPHTLNRGVSLQFARSVCYNCGTFTISLV